MDKINWGSAALVIIDVQNDFCKGGSLAVPDGDAVVPEVNKLVQEALNNGSLIIATRDWHPNDTVHFQQWPAHCVQNTHGAEYHSDLVIPMTTVHIEKGCSADDDESYSGFEGRTIDAAGLFLDEVLQRHNIHQLVVCGLATDYCVKNTVLDGVINGYHVYVVKDACRGVDPTTTADAWDEMETFGAEIV